MPDPSIMNVTVEELAEQQGGVITRMQALVLGMTTDAVDARLKSGRWRRLYRGVYATFTGRPDREASLWAALLVCGHGAVLSHETAAELWGLQDVAQPVRNYGGDSRPSVHVTIPSGRRVKPRSGVVLHHSSRLAVSRHPGRRPPRTRLEDTIVDLTQSATCLDSAIGVITEAVRRKLTTHERMLTLFDARKKLRWRTELTEACSIAGTGAHSLLEFRFLTSVERPHGLPPTQRQVRRRSGGRNVFVDARNAEYGVRVELDGIIGHVGDAAFRDMRRDNEAAAEGDVTLRFGWDDITSRPCEAADLLARVLASRGWAGRPTPCGPSCILNVPGASSLGE